MSPSPHRLTIVASRSRPCASAVGAGGEDGAGAERRRHPRVVRLDAAQQPAGRLAIVDVSSFGCCLRHADPAIGPGHFVGLTFATLGTISGYVRWRDGASMGVEFCRALSPAAERALASDERLETVRRL